MSAEKRSRRVRTTRPAVKIVDRAARHVIRIGGIGTIAAISMVFFFLSWVVWPLVRSESLGEPRSVPAGMGAARIVATGTDDTMSLVWACDEAGRFAAFDAAGGARLSGVQPFTESPTAWSFPVRSSKAIFGFADGTIRFVEIEHRTEYRDAAAMPAGDRDRPLGERFVMEGKVAERVGADQFALRSIAWTASDPVPIAAGTPIVAVDLSMTPGGPASASVDRDGTLRVSQVRTTRNLLTGKDKLSTTSGELKLDAVAERGLPRWVLLRGLGDNALAVWEDGFALRVDVRRLAEPQVAEHIDFVPSPGARISAIGFLNGKNTLLVGDTEGGLAAWFRVPAPNKTTSDRTQFLRAHDLGNAGTPVVSIASSPRTRLMAAGYADGSLRVFHVTSDRLVAESRVATARAVGPIALVPDDTAIVAWAEGLVTLALDAPHPEVSWRSLLQPIPYEGYANPEHVWQSSSGTDDFEPKFGLWPLVFGTLKATLYAMMFGVPIALMAAIYTSEFLHPDVKSKIKPTIEMMASLPSVVLGFVAALVLAPIVEQIVPEVMTAVLLVPFTLLLGAHLWQFVPGGRRSALQGGRLALSATAIGVGLLGAFLCGPLLERWLFAGDLRLWLDGKAGGAAGGWIFFLAPLAAVAAGALAVRTEPRVLPGRGSAPLRSLLTFTSATALTIVLAVAGANLVSAFGLDLRGGPVGTYVQRNALVVGFVMAFAIVPIIYTIAEDALSSIPENLRAGSLALGATPWQTAVRIVVPTAMSGLFSAIMVGLGRAVGETMIVLMAAGNTPVLDWNVFNGFRTLSANIAVELPEAVRNGTHYRTLFLAAFTLFVMTFVLNTAAELIRLRFRRRAQQL